METTSTPLGLSSPTRPRPLLRALSKDAESMIRSGIRIPSVTQAALELAYNAIDAGADDIAVTVNPSSFKLQVRDNGCGIESGSLGTVAKRYATNKSGHMFPSFGDVHAHPAAAVTEYGFRGETLSSIREISR